MRIRFFWVVFVLVSVFALSAGIASGSGDGEGATPAEGAALGIDGPVPIPVPPPDHAPAATPAARALALTSAGGDAAGPSVWLAAFAGGAVVLLASMGLVCRSRRVLAQEALVQSRIPGRWQTTGS